MIAAFALLLVLHWLIHLLGAAMAFGWAELPQLTRPIAPLVGVQWIGASLLSLGTAVSLFVWPRGWWLIGACAVAVSMAVIIPSWSDAKFGALANAIIIVGVGFGVLSNGPFSLRAEYERDVARLLPRDDAVPPITDADLAHLPVPVQRYLRITGVIGQPRVRSLRVRMHGRIRSGHEARWMPFSAEQYNFVNEPARLFYLTAAMFTIPVQGYHRYVGSAASMRLKAAALAPVVNASGTELTHSETVTMFNDMCIMAPATLIDPAIVWEPVDARTMEALHECGAYDTRAADVQRSRRVDRLRFR